MLRTSSSVLPKDSNFVLNVFCERLPLFTSRRNESRLQSSHCKANYMYKVHMEIDAKQRRSFALRIGRGNTLVGYLIRIAAILTTIANKADTQKDVHKS
jgi:hypothetical protein